MDLPSLVENYKSHQHFWAQAIADVLLSSTYGGHREVLIFLRGNPGYRSLEIIPGEQVRVRAKYLTDHGLLEVRTGRRYRYRLTELGRLVVDYITPNVEPPMVRSVRGAWLQYLPEINRLTAQGYTYPKIARRLDISYVTLVRYRRMHPELFVKKEPSLAHCS